MDAPGRRPRIWIVDPIDYAGMAYYDDGLATGLSHAGADVTVAGSDHRLLPPAHDAPWAHVAVFRGTSGDGGRLVRGGRYVASLIRLLRAIRRAAPSAVIWQYPELPVADLLAIRMLRALGIPVAFVAHEVEPWNRSRAARWVRRGIVRSASVVLTHGEPEAALAVTLYGLAQGRVAVTGHGDFRRFLEPMPSQAEARGRLGLPDGSPVALFFGSLRPTKGLGLLLDAWPAVAAGRSEARLIVAGRAPRGVAAPPAAPGLVRLEGTISPETATDCFAAADVVVIPYDRITTSAVLRHAWSAERPVIATSVGELARHVVPGDTGWLVPPGDAAALATALGDALSDTARCHRMGERGRAYATAAFDWDAIAASVLAALERPAARTP